MKNFLRQLIALGCLAWLIAGPILWATTKEAKPAPKGSIHPVGKVKPADLPSLARISFQQATVNALAAVPGAVIKAELEVEDGCLMYSFEIVGTGKKIMEVEIDAGNGKMLETEDEENEKEDKKD